MKKLLFLLGLIPALAFGQLLNEQNVFEGNTKYQYSGELARVCWTPPVEDWSGVFVFEMQVRHFERNEIVFSQQNISSTMQNFIIPRTGHYEIRVRTCNASDLAVCSGWASAARGAGSTGACAPDSDKEQRDWWLFAWIAAPTFPEQ